ncbi:Protein-lysine N-methyltransferase EFM3 (Elongation factor methyltransferase 3) [Durusdinium trenchii]|uniref:Protein-lysine N-methyltransferase EFM3 (Elongation factor methyltransferase 3) n=1 Tax=Durusdinium trenchii TaxID=1381693 RepID=A0ABP0KDN5_9DINO
MFSFCVSMCLEGPLKGTSDDCKQKSKNGIFRCAQDFEGLRDSGVYHKLVKQLLEEGDDLWEVQCELLQLFHDELLRDFPPLPTARRSLAKAVIKELEELEEVHDELFEVCASHAATASSHRSAPGGFVGHRIFRLSQAGHVVLRVAEQIGGGLETGGLLWTGACTALGLALGGALPLRGRILELGAGTGFLGLALAVHDPTLHVTLSDHQPQVLENLRYNVEATKKCNPSKELHLEVEALDWCHMDHREVDVVVGSDLAYDALAMPGLAAALAKLLAPRGTAQHAFLTCVKRQEATIEALKAAVTSEGLSWHLPEISSEAQHLAEHWALQGCDASAEVIFLQVTGDPST